METSRYTYKGEGFSVIMIHTRRAYMVRYLEMCVREVKKQVAVLKRTSAGSALLFSFSFQVHIFKGYIFGIYFVLSLNNYCLYIPLDCPSFNVLLVDQVIQRYHGIRMESELWCVTMYVSKTNDG